MTGLISLKCRFFCQRIPAPTTQVVSHGSGLSKQVLVYWSLSSDLVNGLIGQWSFLVVVILWNGNHDNTMTIN